METDWVAVEKLLMRSNPILHAPHVNLLRQVFSIRIARMVTKEADGGLPAYRPASRDDRCPSS